MPEPGNQVVEVPAEVTTKKGKKMADLPENVLHHLMKTGSEAYQAEMNNNMINGDVAHNLARQGATTKFNELGTLESRAHSGVMATPIASPANQNGGK